MIPIKDLLNKIKWDKRQNPKDYTLAYTDRVLNKQRVISYSEISSMEGNFMKVGNAMIPLHRISKVFKKGKLVWERKARR